MNESVREALIETNPWWKGLSALSYKTREIYADITKYMPQRQILALTGLRRVGKTVLLQKIAQDQCNLIDPLRVMYFTFDSFREIPLREIISEYEQIHGKDLINGKYLFLFDEIQKVPDWEEQLKRVYDAFPSVKIVISGSESLFIRKKSKESLAGRCYEFKVHPLSLREFLLFKGVPLDPVLHKEEILREFQQFLLTNGFPEIINAPPEIIKRYIQETIIDRIIYKDIPNLFPIKEPAILHDLFTIIYKDPGQIIQLETLSNEIGLSRQTISIYLDFLEKSFLIKKIYNYSRNARKTQRKLKKYYPTILSPDLVEKPEWTGKIFETAMILQLESEYFWRDNYKNEIDAVIEENGIPTPIEIKHGKIDTRGVLLFMKKFKLKYGIIITFDTKRQIKTQEKTVDVLPFYEYLLKKK